jgi:hypothetical protein
MNKRGYCVQFIFIISFSCTLTTTIAQSVKPAFRQFIFTTYRPDSTGNNVNIEDYFRIDSKGMLNYISNISLVGVRDSTYKAPNKLIIMINQIVNSKKKLKSHVISTEPPTNVIFSGPPYFITFTDDENVTEHLVYAWAELDKQFNDLLNEFWHLPFVRISHTAKKYHNKQVEYQIIQDQKSCQCIPKIVEPPRQREK